MKTSPDTISEDSWVRGALRGPGVVDASTREQDWYPAVYRGVGWARALVVAVGLGKHEPRRAPEFEQSRLEASSNSADVSRPRDFSTRTIRPSSPDDVFVKMTHEHMFLWLIVIA
jgi:hypothetical protein